MSLRVSIFSRRHSLHHDRAVLFPHSPDLIDSSASVIFRHPAAPQ
ncbi:hypothetical protein BSLA_02f1389 [Burkholderia stabilis]|nr:hypothetical protein BSLA_02f1389 [Burkholderia stabilis]